MQYRAGLVARDPTLRSQLRQCMDAIETIGSVSTYSDLPDCLSVIRSGNNFDILILEYSVAKTDQSDFISIVKSKPRGRRTIFISVVPSSKQTSQTLTEQLLLGFHNILCEPYSVASLEEILHIGESMRAQSTVSRLRIAAHLLVGDAMGALDKNNQSPGSSVVTSVKNSCQKFCQDAGVTASGYFRQLITNIHSETPRERIGYAGVSERVRKNIVARLKGIKKNTTELDGL